MVKSSISSFKLFFTPVIFQNGEKNRRQRVSEGLDNYLHVGKGKFRVVKPMGRHHFEVQPFQEKPRLLLTVVKVISWATLILPALAFLGKLLFRTANHFEVIPIEEASEQLQETTKKITKTSQETINENFKEKLEQLEQNEKLEHLQQKEKLEQLQQIEDLMTKTDEQTNEIDEHHKMHQEWCRYKNVIDQYKDMQTQCREEMSAAIDQNDPKTIKSLLTKYEGILKERNSKLKKAEEEAEEQAKIETEEKAKIAAEKEAKNADEKKAKIEAEKRAEKRAEVAAEEQAKIEAQERAKQDAKMKTVTEALTKQRVTEVEKAFNQVGQIRKKCIVALIGDDENKERLEDISTSYYGKIDAAIKQGNGTRSIELLNEFEQQLKMLAERAWDKKKKESL